MDTRKQNNAFSSQPLDPELVGKGAMRGAKFKPLKWLIVAVLALVVLAVLAVVFAPQILSSDKVRNMVVAQVNDSGEGVEFGIDGWHWRWRSPCRVDGISLKAADGSYDARVESIEISNGLLAWASKNRQNFGVITIKNPSVKAVVDSGKGGGLGAPGSSGRTPRGGDVDKDGAPKTGGEVPISINPVGKIVVVGGMAEVVRADAPAVVVEGIDVSLEFSGLDGAVSFNVGSGLPMVGGAAAKPGDRMTASVRFSSLRSLLGDSSRLTFNADVNVPSVDLAALDKFVPSQASRVVMESGRAEAVFSARRGDDGVVNISGGFGTSGVRLGGAVLSGDAPSWDKASLDFDVSLGKSALKVVDISLDSPFAVFEAAGEIALGDRPSGTLSAKGDVDLAAIAAQLPATLNMQDGVSLKRGGVVFEIEAEAGDAGMRVFSLARSSGFEAIRNGEPLALDLPFTLSANADLSPTGAPLGGALNFKSTPAELKVQGNEKEGSATGSADLGKLHAALAPVLKLGRRASMMQGKLDGGGSWKRAGEEMEISGRIDGRELKLPGKGGKALEFSAASAVCSAVVPANGMGAIKKLKAEVRVPFAVAEMAAGEIVPGKKELKNFSLDAESQWSPLLALAGVEGKEGDVPFADIVAVSLAGNYADDNLKLDRFTCVAGPVGASGEASVEALTTERLARASGLLDIDFDKLQTFIGKKKIDGVKVSGKSSRQFRLFVPLGDGDTYMKSNMSAALGVVVPALAGMGLEARDAEINVGVGNGMVKVESGAAVNEGAFALVADVGISDEPPVVTVPSDSRVLDNVKVTQGMLEQMFARVHPVLLGCAVMSGNVSVDVAKFSAPLSANVTEEMEWTVAATLSDTRLAASGLLKQIADALECKHTEVLITNQTLGVECRGGRFFPDPLDLEIDGHAMRVAGSVGIDGSLDYGVSLPLSERLVGKEAYSRLKGRTLNIPITGTAKKPRIDANALQAELRRLISDVAKDVVVEEVKDKALDELRGRIKEDDVKKIEDALKLLGR